MWCMWRAGSSPHGAWGEERTWAHSTCLRFQGSPGAPGAGATPPVVPGGGRRRAPRVADVHPRTMHLLHHAPRTMHLTDHLRYTR